MYLPWYSVRHFWRGRHWQSCRRLNHTISSVVGMYFIQTYENFVTISKSLANIFNPFRSIFQEPVANCKATKKRLYYTIVVNSIRLTLSIDQMYFSPFLLFSARTDLHCIACRLSVLHLYCISFTFLVLSSVHFFSPLNTLNCKCFRLLYPCFQSLFAST